MRVVTHDELKALLADSETPVLVDFFAEWCGPCKMLAPIIEELAPEYEGKVQIVKVDIDDQPEAAQAHGVQSIPTLVYFNNGEETDRSVGFQNKDMLEQKLKSL